MGLGFRLESQGSLVRFPAATFIFGFKFWLVSAPNSSAVHLQMKSRMTIQKSLKLDLYDLNNLQIH